MNDILAPVHPNSLSVFLVAIPAVLLAEYFAWSPVLVFALSATGLIPLAGSIAKVTEELAAPTEPRVGGLMNATLGNAAVLIITLATIKEGFLELATASITGSTLGNLLFVLGMALLPGGLIKWGSGV